MKNVKKNRSKGFQWMMLTASAAITFVYLTLPYKTVKNTLGIGFGLRHNDHVMIGTIALIAGAVLAYSMAVGRKP